MALTRTINRSVGALAKRFKISTETLQTLNYRLGMRFRVGAHWTFAMRRYSKVENVFTVSRNRAPSLASASAQWVESYFAVTRRHYKVVALCNTDVLALVQLQLHKALGPRPVKDSVAKLIACDHELSRLCIEFEAGDCERNCLSETVRRLCTMPGVRYVRLDPH